MRGRGRAGPEPHQRLRQDAQCRDRRHVRRRRVTCSTQRLAEVEKARQEASRGLSPTSASCSRTSPSTPSPSPRPTTGTRCMTIWACQAGKDVYVEKPCSHNIFEGRQIVAAAQKYNRIVQHGTQSRSVAGRAGGRPADARRADRRGLHGARAVLQVARHHRPHAGRAGARRRALRPVAGPGAAARLHHATASTTTGTGSGTTATATSATRASTRWTSPAGAWA